MDTILEPDSAVPQSAVLSVFPWGWHGKDRTGRPVRYDCLGRLDADDWWGVMAGDEDRTTIGRANAIRYAARQSEEFCRVVAPKAAAENGHAVYDFVYVLDLGRLNLSRMRKWDKAYVEELVGMLNTVYPEVLHKW